VVRSGQLVSGQLVSLIGGRSKLIAVCAEFLLVMSMEEQLEAVIWNGRRKKLTADR